MNVMRAGPSGLVVLISHLNPRPDGQGYYMTALRAWISDIRAEACLFAQRAIPATGNRSSS